MVRPHVELAWVVAINNVAVEKLLLLQMILADENFARLRNCRQVLEGEALVLPS